MEEVWLQDMIRDRETQITLIKRKMEEQSSKMERVLSALASVKETVQTQTLESRRELETLYQRQEKAHSQYKEAKDSLDMKKQQQGAQLHLYNEIMKSIASPESRDSSYVMRMQAQLCKAMHSMGMAESQLSMSADAAEDIQKQLKEFITHTVEEKSQIELQLMNELLVADVARREVEEKHHDMMETFTKDKDALLERIEKEQEQEEQEDSPEEDDDEEKEELQEILIQGREEIERLEQENAEELQRLEDAKKKVAGIKGETFVEELVASIAEEFKEEEEEDEESDEED